MVSDYLLHASKHLRHVFETPQLVIPLALVCVSGWLIVWLLPDVHQSETSINVNTKFGGGCIFNSQEIAEENLGDLAGVFLLSSVNLEFVAASNDMLLDPRTVLERKSVLADLKNNVRLVSRGRQSDGDGFQLLVISYRNVDAERSKGVVSSFLSLLFYGIDSRCRTRTFYDMHIKSSSGLLKDAGDQLIRFRTENARYEYDQDTTDQSEVVFTVPELEKRFRKLNQNYNMNLQRYEHFLRRRQTAELGSSNRSPIPEYQIVEGPKTLSGPVEPNRPLLNTLVFIGALALATFISMLLGLINPSDSNQW